MELSNLYSSSDLVPILACLPTQYFERSNDYVLEFWLMTQTYMNS